MRGRLDFDKKSGKYLFTCGSYDDLLSCGARIKVCLDGEWIEGQVEHTSKIKNGYYFLYKNEKIPLSEIDYIEYIPIEYWKSNEYKA